MLENARVKLLCPGCSTEEIPLERARRHDGPEVRNWMIRVRCPSCWTESVWLPAAIRRYVESSRATAVVAWSDHVDGDWRQLAAIAKSLKGAVLKRRDDNGEWHNLGTINARED